MLALPPPVTPHTQEGPPLDTVQGMVARLVMCGLAIREAEVAAGCTELAGWSVVIVHAWLVVLLVLAWDSSCLVMAGDWEIRVTRPAKLEVLVTGFKLILF